MLPTLSAVQNKIHILEDMRKLGVLLKPRQLDIEDKQDLMWLCISSSSNNYRQVSTLVCLVFMKNDLTTI
jgi:hypothetical protein